MSERLKQAARTVKWRLFPGDPYVDMEPGFAQVRDRVSGFTMTSVERQYALWRAVRHIEAARVPGDVVECGVWRGGSSMLAALTLINPGTSAGAGAGDGSPEGAEAGSREARRLWLFDTFEGMTEPGEFDVSLGGRRVADEWEDHAGQVHSPLFAYGSLDEVRRNMESTGYPKDLVEFIQGRVEETVPARAPDEIALLRLDTDWYESTRHELEHLWPRLSSGGVILIDDYGHWAGARKAVDEFFEGRADAPLLNRVDYSGRIGTKP